MHNIQSILIKNLKKQKLVRISASELIRKVIENNIKENTKITFKNQIIYVKNLPPNKKFEIYINKKSILEEIEKKLKKMGLNIKVKDIRVI